MKLSIVIPAYNEERTLPEVIAAVRAVPLGEVEREIVVVNDGSTDGTRRVIESLAGPDLVAVNLETNRGKGAAMRRGIEASSGEYVLVQDADLEYDPADYPALLAPLRNGTADAVYGSRILGGNAGSYRAYYWGGRLLTLVFNLLYGTGITDLTTCYKIFSRADAIAFRLECDGFEFCEEVTARLVRSRKRLVEVPVRYRPRSFSEGKKIRWTDGIQAVRTMLRLRLSRPR